MSRSGRYSIIASNIPRRHIMARGNSGGAQPPAPSGAEGCASSIRPGRLIALIALPLACLASCRSGPDLRDPQGFRPTLTAAVSAPPAALIAGETPLAAIIRRPEATDNDIYLGAMPPGGGNSPSQPAAIIHVITPDCVSAQQIARAHGYRGDWRDYMTQIRDLNGWGSWPGWPLLHVGDRILIPTVSTGAQPCAPTIHDGQAPRPSPNPPSFRQGMPARTHTVGQVSNLPAGAGHAAVPRARSHSREVTF